MSDYEGVGCEDYRELLSAGLDGEATPDERAAADNHVATCMACRRWLDQAAAVTRLVRTGPALPSLDVTAAVLAAAPGRARARLAVALRLLLAGFGVAQLLLGVAQAVAFAAAGQHLHNGAVVNGASAGHLWHESAAWNVAVAAGFLWVAARRGRPAGIIPILTAFVGVLALLSAGDVMAGRVDVARLASHAFVLVGYLIVLALSRPSLTLGGPSGRRAGEPPDHRTGPDRTGQDHGTASVLPFPSRLRGVPAPEVKYRDAA